MRLLRLQKSARVVRASFFCAFSVFTFMTSMVLRCQQTAITPPFPIRMHQGAEEFQRLSQNMQTGQVFGVLPKRSEFLCPEPLKNSVLFFSKGSQVYEFFLYDEKEILLILEAEDPFYFLQLSLPSVWKDKLQREVESLSRGVVRKKKDWSSLPTLIPWEEDWFSIYFTPQEFHYSLSPSSKFRYKLKQANATDHPVPDFWRLIESAHDITISVPIWQDESLAQVLAEKRKKGHKISIYTSEFTPESIPNEHITATGKNLFPFGIAIGQNLEVTQDLLNGRNLKYLDNRLLTSDFMFLFSVPWGNPIDTPSINQRDGIVFLMRGDLDPILRQFNHLARNISAIPATGSPTDDGSQNIQKNPKFSDRNIWCQNKKDFSSITPLTPLDSSGCLKSLRGVLLSEIGDNKSPDDYVTIYNTNDRCVDLNLSQAVLQRDSNCKITEGKVSGKHRLAGIIPPHSAMVLGEMSNRLEIPQVLPDSFSLNGQSYCLALTATNESIRSAEDPHIFDFIAIGEGGDSNAKNIQPRFPLGQALVRSCFNRWEIQTEPKPGLNIPQRSPLCPSS